MGGANLSVVKWWRAHYLRRRREEAMDLTFDVQLARQTWGLCVTYLRTILIAKNQNVI